MKIIYVFVFISVCKRSVVGQINNDVNKHAKDDDYDEYDEDYSGDTPEYGGECGIFTEDPKVVKCCPENKLVEQVGDVFSCSDLPKHLPRQPWIPPGFVHGHDSCGDKQDLTTEYETQFSDIPLAGNLSHCFGQEIYFWEPDYILTNMEAHGETKSDFYKCMDRIIVEGQIKERPVAFNCRDKVDTEHGGNGMEHDGIMRIVQTVAGALGIICLLGALIVYLLLPSKRNPYGQIVTWNIVSTLGVTIFLLLVYHSDHVAESMECKAIGYTGYFLTMAMFSWMTVLCIDLFWTFVRPFSSPSKGKRLLIFHLVGWGLPSLLTGLVGLLDHLDINNKPGIGIDKCFINDHSALFYLHIPITLLITVNVILYLITVRTIRRIRMDAKGNRSELEAAKEQFLLFTKMFVIMGVLWACESLQYYVHKLTGDIRAVSVLFDIFAVLNMLRGVFIFIIFICKVSVWNSLKKLRKKKNYNVQATMYLSSRKMERTTTSVACSTTYA